MRSTKRIAKWMTGAALLGALAFVVPQQAQAQVSFGVAVGGYPGYAQPYFHNDYERQRWFEHEQHERFEAEQAEFRREQWEREHAREHFDHDFHDHDFHDRGWHGDRY